LTVIIDTHVHLDRPGPAVDQAELATLLRRADAAGIERLLLAGSVMQPGTHPSLEGVRAVNDQTMAAVRQEPDRLWGLCYVNPRHGQAAREEILRCVRDGGLCGIKLWVAARAGDRVVDVVAETAVELGVAVLQHAWDHTPGSPPDQSRSTDVAELAGRFPALRIQMAHMNGVGCRGLNEVAGFANVWVDTAGAQPLTGTLEYALERLGPGRIVFGSDYPVREFGVKLASVRATVGDESVRRALLHDNALALWNKGGSTRT
jgi:predicted TIM-barrel fold metal-dependent hydrolase